PLKLVYKGKKSETFIIFVDSSEALESYKANPKTTPLTEVVSNFHIYKTITGQGAEGQLESASKLELADEFDDETVEKILPVILQEGTLQHAGIGGKKFSSKNDSNG
ncbi:hypothetical protein CANARDRAFT_189008, partial [[Candida] arabinofermentans NRRL YB-2248]